MAGIAVWNPFQIILMLGLGLPEVARRYYLGNDLSWPQA
jgi:hypothetical protein